MSTVVRRRNVQQEPPKKSRVGLIITIIVIIVISIVIAVVIFFVLRARNTPPPGGCLTDPDCPTGKVCNTVTKTCLECLTSANCTGAKKTCDAGTNTCVGCLSDANCPSPNHICDVPNKTCVECLNNTNCPSGEICNTTTKACETAECSTNTDCASSPTEKACNGGVCVQCNSNLDCINTPAYASVGKNTCDTTAHVCKECISNLDCPGSGTCTGGVCCDATPPTITLITASRGPTCSIAFTYTTVQNLTGLTYITELSDPVSGAAVYTSASTATGSTTTTGQVILTDTDIGIFLIPGISYNAKIKISTSCGSTPFSPTSLITIPVDKSAGMITAAAGKIPAPTGPLTVSLNSGGFSATNGANVWVVASKLMNVHPNRAEMIKLMSQVSNTCFPNIPGGNSICPEINFTTTWATGITPLLGETWYVRVFYEQGYDQNVPGSLMSISGLSDEDSLVITL